MSHKIDDSTCADQFTIVRLHLLARSGLLCGSQHLVTRTPCATPTMTATIAAAISEDEPLQTGYVSFLFVTRSVRIFLFAVYAYIDENIESNFVGVRIINPPSLVHGIMFRHCRHPDLLAIAAVYRPRSRWT